MTNIKIREKHHELIYPSCTFNKTLPPIITIKQTPDTISSINFHCCCSVAHSCPILCNPMDCSTPSLPTPHHLLEFAQVYVHCIGWCHSAISSSDALLFCSQAFPASGTFPMSWLFASDDQNTEASTSALVLPMSIQGWYPLRLTGLISTLYQYIPLKDKDS